MNHFISFSEVWKLFAPYFVALIILSAIGVVGKIALFSKANKPFWAAFVPGYDVVVFMSLVGRPAYHALWLLVPVVNVFFAARLCVETAQSFGKNSSMDAIFAIVFNVFYVLNLGLAYNIEYQSPAYLTHANSAAKLKASPAVA
jgi:signal peptidase I